MLLIIYMLEKKIMSFYKNNADIKYIFYSTIKHKNNFAVFYSIKKIEDKKFAKSLLKEAIQSQAIKKNAPTKQASNLKI